MRKWVLILCCFWGMLGGSAVAGTYTLNDGTQISGEPLSYNEQGVRIKTGPDTFSPRISWNDFTQDSLRLLRQEAKTPQEQAILDPLIEELPSEKAKWAEINVKPITPPVRPSRLEGPFGFFALFSSPLGWVIILILYGAGLFAAYEAAVFRHQPRAAVVGLAAVPLLGLASPIICLALPTRKGEVQTPRPVAGAAGELASPLEPPPEGQMPGGAGLALGTQTGTATVAEPAPAAVELPPPIIFRRGEYSFNRRFFETKLPGFFRVVPSEAEKDLLLHIKSSRGEFVGKRITRVTLNELYLQIFSKEATADEMIPFMEVMEVQVRHKDLA